MFIRIINRRQPWSWRGSYELVGFEIEKWKWLIWAAVKWWDIVNNKKHPHPPEKAAFYIEKHVLTSPESQDWGLNNKSEFEIL